MRAQRNLLIALTNSAAEGCRMRSRKSCKPKNTSAFSILRRLVDTAQDGERDQTQLPSHFTQNLDILLHAFPSHNYNYNNI